MKIVFLSVFNFTDNIGGVENHIYNLAKELIGFGHEVVIVQPVAVENPKESVIIDGIKTIFVNIGVSKIRRFTKKYQGIGLLRMFTAFLGKASYFFGRKIIARKVLELAPDLVHQHDFIANIFTTKIISKSVPCVLTNHTGEYLYLRKIPMLSKILLRYLLSHFNYIIGPSIELTPEFLKNTLTIHNGADLEYFVGDALIKKEAKNKYKNKFLVFCPRRWAPTKGVKYLAKAVSNGFFDDGYVFFFAGSDYDGFTSYKNEINMLLDDKLISCEVYRLGNLNKAEMKHYYQICDVSIIPSLMEAVSLSAIESMACGTPIISTNVGGMPELISDQYNGILINPYSDKEIADSIINLKNNRDLYLKLRENGLSSAQSYSWSEIASQTMSVYRIALGNE